MSKVFVPTLDTCGFLLPVGYLRNRLGAVEYNKLLTSLTVKHQQTIGPPKVARAYRIIEENNARFIALPRTICMAYIDNQFIKKYNMNMPRGHNIALNMIGAPTPYQSAVIDQLMAKVYTDNNINRGSGNCTFVMGAGKGKTFVAAGLIHKLARSALYIVPNKHLRGQTVDDMRVMFGGATIYQVKAKEVEMILTGKQNNNKKIFDFRRADICVCVINTAIKLDVRFYSQFGFIIFDEVHMYCAPEFSRIFWLAQAACVLGLTATPNRDDGFDIIFRKCVGETINATDLVAEEQNVQWLGEVTAIFYHGPKSHTQTLSRTIAGESRVDTQKMLKQLIEDEKRNELIVNQILLLYNDEQRNIFAFSESRDFLLLISDLLSAKMNEKIGVLRGGVTRDQITIAVGTRIILTTYAYSGTGVSIKKMNSLIFLTPRRSNMIQILGRILRLGGDPTIRREIIDIVDASTPLRGQFSSKNPEKRTRQHAYDFYNFPVKIKHVYAADNLKDKNIQDNYVKDDNNNADTYSDDDIVYE